MTTASGRRNISGANGDGSATDYGSELWRMADVLRGSMDTAIEDNLTRLGFGTGRIGDAQG